VIYAILAKDIYWTISAQNGEIESE